MRFWAFLFLLSFFGCGAKTQPPQPDDRLVELQLLFGKKINEAKKLRDPKDGWLVKDCDGMIWTGKYASVVCDQVNITAAEGKKEPGRFYRYPNMTDCKTSWSRDMGIGGLMPFAYKCKRRDILERHAKYGVDNSWIMGWPIDDLRPIYTPAMVGLTYELIFALGGEDNKNRYWPKFYAAGLDDYEAHLQMMHIWFESQVKVITQNMHARIVEHYQREPNNPFYAYMMGRYNGSMGEVIALLLDPRMPMGSYVRCDEPKRCRLAEWLFVANEVLNWYEQNNI